LALRKAVDWYHRQKISGAQADIMTSLVEAEDFENHMAEEEIEDNKTHLTL